MKAITFITILGLIYFIFSFAFGVGTMSDVIAIVVLIFVLAVVASLPPRET